MRRDRRRLIIAAKKFDGAQTDSIIFSKKDQKHLSTAVVIAL